MNTSPKPPHNTIRPGVYSKPGFASTLTVISIGAGLLLILVSLYNSTVESQSAHKDHMLRSDYQQREEAFLRALTNIVPNQAIRCMQDNSDANANTLNWNSLFTTALTLSNSSNQGIDDADTQTLLGLDPTDFRSGNSAEANTPANVLRQSVIRPSALLPNGQILNDDLQVASGSGQIATNNYPPPLTLINDINNPDENDAVYPLVSLNKQYGTSADGWVQAETADHPLYLSLIHI